jgi:uncharacterized OB-fold protein
MTVSEKAEQSSEKEAEAVSPRPKPYIRKVNEEFWRAASENRLVIQRCQHCGRWQYPPVERCPQCGSAELSWLPASGKGVVHTFTVFHIFYDKAFKDDLPYNVAVIALEEGPLMLSNIIGIDNDAIEIGMPVEVTFVDRDGTNIPQFRPVAK